MPEFVACPACGFRVQMADAVLGRRVRCMNCDHRFVAGPAAEIDLPPQRIEPLPPRPPDLAPPRRGGPPPLPRDFADPRTAGPPPGGRLPLCPACARGVAWDALRCLHCGQELEADYPAADRLPTRRDADDHRGGVLMAMGNLTLLAGGLSLCLFGGGLLIALPLGLTTWAMANRDLARMQTGEMDAGSCQIRRPGAPAPGWVVRPGCACGRCKTENGRTSAITGIVLGVVFAAGYAVLFLGKLLS
jgi:hypothetical protein